ncbi:MAG: geranylgeranylglyceryl/heptaprenylglyceryl phosphate synthase [Crocinitomicaceae bacterium]
MGKLYDILHNNKQKLAILIDPDKTNTESDLVQLVSKIKLLHPTFIFVGGSTVDQDDLKKCIAEIKKSTTIPVIIFPGSHLQVNEQADGILFLSLLSGRNPDYLIGHQVESAPHLRNMDIETIATAYLLIDGGKSSSVSYVSQTSPIPADQIKIAVNTAIAGEMLGFSCVFMDAGSGALQPISNEMIRKVKENISVPLIVGGGVRSLENLEGAYASGADLVVIGNKVEEDIDFLLDLKNYFSSSDL